jgi:RND family efflux transporter MFP subunit
MRHFFINRFWILMLIGLFSCNNEKAVKQIAPSIKPIKYGKILRTGDSDNQEYAGTVQSSKEAKLSFKVNGNINYLAIKVGDKVRRGQLIARVDATDYQVQVEQANSNLLNAETQIKSRQSQLINARATYQRIEKLYENNSVSLSDFEQAKSTLETAEAGFQAAKAQAGASATQVQSSKNQVSYSQLLAPFSGVITSIAVEENEFVGAGAPVATLNSETQPEIRVGIPEKVIAQIKKGQKVKIHFAVFNEDYTGVVSEVGYSTAGGSTYPVIIRIEKPIQAIRPGMAAHVHFNFASGKDKGAKKLFAPIASVGEDNNGNFVYILKPESDYYTVQKQTIKIGALAGNGFELLGGIDEGALVATSGLQSLISGMKVKLMD